MIKEEVGNRLKESRKAAGFTQRQVAEKLNMLQPSYARYESGVLELDYKKRGDCPAFCYKLTYCSTFSSNLKSIPFSPILMISTFTISPI